MTYDPDIWQAGSSCHYLGQVRRLRLQVKKGGKSPETVGMANRGRKADLN